MKKKQRIGAQNPNRLYCHKKAVVNDADCIISKLQIKLSPNSISNTVLMGLVSELLQGKLVYRWKMCSFRKCSHADSEEISWLLLLYMNLLLHGGTVNCFLMGEACSHLRVLLCSD